MPRRPTITCPKLYHKQSPLAVLLFNIERYRAYTRALDNFPGEHPDKFLRRERGEIFKNAIRNNHPLRFCQPGKSPSLYTQRNILGAKSVMDHAIPICVWPANLDKKLRSLSCDDERDAWVKTLILLGWCSPIVRIDKAADRLIDNSGQRYVNRNPEMPFHRLREAEEGLSKKIEVANFFNPNADAIDLSLAGHYALLEKEFEYFRPIFAEARKWGVFDSAIRFMSTSIPTVGEARNHSAGDNGPQLPTSAERFAA